jgi:hypothetical protein
MPDRQTPLCRNATCTAGSDGEVLRVVVLGQHAVDVGALHRPEIGIHQAGDGPGQALDVVDVELPAPEELAVLAVMVRVASVSPGTSPAICLRNPYRANTSAACLPGVLYGRSGAAPLCQRDGIGATTPFLQIVRSRWDLLASIPGPGPFLDRANATVA